MPEIEITAIPPLTPSEHSVVNCHALLNLYHVIRTELEWLGTQLDDNPNLFAASLRACDTRVHRLRDASAALHDAATTGDLKTAIERELEVYVGARTSLARSPAVSAWRARLESLFWILDVRAHELLVRSSAPRHWSHCTAAELEADFQEFFRAMQEHSHGRYRVVYNLAVQQPGDYYIDLRFESARGSDIPLPLAFKDVMRDLIANARKYTRPGGHVHAALYSSSEGLRFVVEDTGCGIPEAELAAVVRYGHRGSNVSAIRTLGASCGLTKAFLVTRQLGGRLWLASQEGRGTRVRVWIPARDKDGG